MTGPLRRTVERRESPHLNSAIFEAILALSTSYNNKLVALLCCRSLAYLLFVPPTVSTKPVAFSGGTSR